MTDRQLFILVAGILVGCAIFYISMLVHDSMWYKKHDKNNENGG